jgi:tetratricopeptide (TPR) repeat protein
MISIRLGREADQVASKYRSREQRVLQLTDRARKEFRGGKHGNAIQLQGEAIELCRLLGREHPDDPLHREAAASALYGLGTMLTAADRSEDAVTALEESAKLYQSISGFPGVPDTAPLIADAEIRRARALAVAGRGASAIPDADKAVSACEALTKLVPAGQRNRKHPLNADLARAYAGNALILARFGDPDLAVGSADRAVRLYMRNTSGSGRPAVTRDEEGYLISAASVGAMLHAWHGRIDLSLAAAQIAMSLVDRRRQRELRSIGKQADGMTMAQRADFGSEVTRTLRQAGSGGLEAAAMVFASMPGAKTMAAALARLRDTVEETTKITIPVPEPGGLESVTLADALARARDDELARRLTRPAVDCEITTPSDRCPPQLAPAYAGRLAERALAVLPDAKADGLRIGLEAHYLYAAASEQQVPEMRYRFAESGPTWLSVLRACSSAFRQRAEPAMAADLESWAKTVAAMLRERGLPSG